MSTIDKSINKYNPVVHYAESSDMPQNQKIDVRERNWCAITLDAIGAIPVLGSLAGVVRIVVSVALRAFYRYSMRDGENREIMLLIAQTESEIRRGLLELLPGVIWHFENKQAQAEDGGVDGRVLGTEKAARGNYFYVDPELGLHYVSEMYPDTDCILWQNKMQQTTLNKVPEGPSQGIQGRVFNPETHAPHTFTFGSGITHIRKKVSGDISPLNSTNEWISNKIIEKLG